MSFVHGSNARIYVNGFNMSTFLNSISSSCEIDTHETTTFGTTAKTYIAGLEDATLSAEGLFSGIVGATDAVFFNALSNRAAVIWNWLPSGDINGEFGYGFLAKETSYEIESPVDDLVSVTVESQSSVSRERIQILHPLGLQTITANGVSRDNGVLTNLGGVGYLQVTTVSGTTPNLTVRVQHSVDASVWTDLITFTPVTAANQAQRIAVLGTINRHTRVNWTITGTTPNFTLFAGFGRY